MIRVSKHSLKFSNKNKLNQIEKMFDLYRLTLVQYINQIKNNELPLKTFLSTKECPDCAMQYATYKALAYKHAAEIVRGNLASLKNRLYKRYKKCYSKCKQNNKHEKFTSKHFNELNINYMKRIKINIKNLSITLNENLFRITPVDKEFNEFIKIFLPWYKQGQKRFESVNLPIKYHKHSLKFKDWNRKKSIQLEYRNGKYFLNIFWEKENNIQNFKNFVGIDQGYNKLISDSNSVHWRNRIKRYLFKIK